VLPRRDRLTPRRLQRLISKHEQDDVEFKGRNTSTEELVATVVCFANGEGGLILWGVEKDGAIAGVRDRLKDPASLRKTIYHSTSPSQLVGLQHIDMEGKEVVAISVSHSLVLVSTSGGAYSQRLGTECVPMTPDRLLVRQIDTRSLDFSAALTPVTVNGVDELEVQRFRQQLPDAGPNMALRSLSTPDLLRAVKASGRDNGDELLTIAGLLIFGKEEQLKDTLPQHEVGFLRLGPSGTAYQRRILSSGPLLRLIEQLQTEIKASSRTRTLRFGAQELEFPDYPDRVIREALVNALAHRHFTLPGHVAISQKPGFVEIENPGGFPEGITPETVIQHAPVHRNRLLCEILDKVRYMERSGLGVDRIFEDQLRFGKLPPVYVANRTMVRLRIDSSAFDEPFARMVLSEERAGRAWNVEALLVASYLRRMGPADRGTLARVVQRSDEEAQELISALTPQLLERFGTGAAARYALSARIQTMMGAEVAYTRERGLAREYQRSIVLQHAEKFGRVDNRTVRELLTIGLHPAANLLRALEARGDLVQRGTGRWAQYRPSRRVRLLSRAAARSQLQAPPIQMELPSSQRRTD
jgi:ATP-dependent DNA helicase RecG